jgi:hypothetical protein
MAIFTPLFRVLLLLTVSTFWLASCGKTEEALIISTPNAPQKQTAGTGSAQAPVNIAKEAIRTGSSTWISLISPEQVGKYRNAQYGFEITFPSNWNKFKYTESMQREGAEYTVLYLPTSDTSWSDAESFPYAQIFTLKITPNIIWDAYLKKCAEIAKKEPLTPLSGDACVLDLKGDLTLKRTSTHTVSILTPQTGPSDINQYYLSMGGSVETKTRSRAWIEYLRNNLTLLSQEASSQAVKVSVSTKDLWNGFQLRQSADDTSVEYKWKVISIWSHTVEKNPFVADACDAWQEARQTIFKTYDAAKSREYNSHELGEAAWQSLSAETKKSCLRDDLGSVTVSALNTPRFFKIVRPLWSWAEHSLFDTQTGVTYPHKVWIEKVEIGKNGIYLLYATWPGLRHIGIIRPSGTLERIWEGGTGAITDYKSATDFEILDNQQIKVIYTEQSGVKMSEVISTL